MKMSLLHVILCIVFIVDFWKPMWKFMQLSCFALSRLELVWNVSLSIVKCSRWYSNFILKNYIF